MFNLNIKSNSPALNLPFYISTLFIANAPLVYLYHENIAIILKSLERPAFVTSTKEIFKKFIKNTYLENIPGANIKLALFFSGFLENIYNVAFNGDIEKLPKSTFLGFSKTTLQSTCEVAISTNPKLKDVLGNIAGPTCYALARAVVKTGKQAYEESTIKAQEVCIETVKEFGSRQLEIVLKQFFYSFDPIVFYIGSSFEGVANILLKSIKEYNNNTLTFYNIGEYAYSSIIGEANDAQDL